MTSIEKQMLGTETAQLMRARGVNSLICGLSANDVEQQFIEAGANAFMHKPFPCQKDALTFELLQILAKSQRSHDDLLKRADSVDRPQASSGKESAPPQNDSVYTPVSDSTSERYIEA